MGKISFRKLKLFILVTIISIIIVNTNFSKGDNSKMNKIIYPKAPPKVT